MSALAVMLVVAGLTRPAVGEPVPVGPEAVGLEDVVRMAGSSALSRAVQADVDVARAEEHQARLLPNPELQYQGYGRLLGTPDAINGQQHQFDIGIPLLIAGQRRARMRSARLETNVVEAESCLATRELQREAALRWTELLVAQELVARLEGGRVALEEAEALTRARAERGAQTEYDAGRVSYELRLLDSEIRGAEAEVRDASASLATVVGRPGWTPRAVGTLGAMETGETTEPPGLNSVPSVLAARRREEAAKAREVLARRERWPVPVIGGGTYVTTDGGSASATFNLSLPLPIFDRGQAQVARARADLRRTELRKDAVERVAEGEISRARVMLRERRDAARAFDEETRDSVPRLRSMAHEAYRGGVSSVLELIDAERTYLQGQLRRLELGGAAALAAVELAAARGTLGERCR